ncbi:peroxisomal membrane anchor protein conserved region-domain-containing protein [Hysterangium stoloniferum]|nr:peroxisomal membrane anchor protein conserved region-domain-containing protein [Hysterangium stoloniferum]
MSTPERQELLRNAIAFLADPKTQASPLTKRIEFLESKGLTSLEIEDAMKQAATGAVTTSVTQTNASVPAPASQYAPSYAPSTYTMPPSVPQLDWRDYFIMAIVSGGVMFGVVSLARKYLFPHLKPPSSTAYEADKDALTAQFDAAEALLKEIQEETTAVRTAAEEQKTKIEKATSDVEAAVKELREGGSQTRNEMREIRQEIDTIRDMLPKMLEKNKEAQSQSLAELQQELKSLKTLLLSRAPSGMSPPPPFPILNGRPSIPAWQLAGADASSASTSTISRRSLNLTNPNQLAESARSNLRKTLMSSRSSSPVPSHSQEKAQPRRTITLEERLRASFIVGEASERTTPDVSKVHTPNEVDPAAVELPLSPGTLPFTPSQELPLTSLEEALDPLGAQLSPTPSRSVISSLPTASFNVDYIPSPITVEINAYKDDAQLNILNESSSSSPSVEMAVADQQQPPQAHAVENLGPSSSQNPVTKETDDAISQTELSLAQAEIPDSSSATAEELEIDVEKLRERLKLVEQRFTDISSSFKRLQAEKDLADQVLKDHTPVESILDVDTLRDHFKNMKMRAEISAEEIKRLHATIQQHDVRLEELRDTHRLESSSQSEQIERLRQQVLEIEALLKASEEISGQSKADILRLQTELEKSKGVAKEEEEKRTKAISLLKTVRAKLVKAEKEKEDVMKEAVIVKEREEKEKEKERQEKVRLEGEFDRMKQDKEREISSLRSQFEQELVAVKERNERENSARRGQFELEAITTKAAHAKELGAKQSRITSLETSVRTLSEEKNSMFDQLQMRQAELESSQSHLESVEARTTELQYQLREAESRIEFITEELSEVRQGVVNENSSQSSAEELARILSETEGKYEARISELRSRMRALEKERQEAEDEWSRNLQERSRELERLRILADGKGREYAESIRTKTEMEDRIMELQTENRKLRAQKEVEDGVLHGLQNDITWLKEAEASTKQEREELSLKLQAVEKQVEEGKIRENAFKTNNKVLREELRKVQTSAALLERQRNPGIGYWSTSPRTNGFTQSLVELQDPSHVSRSSVDEGSSSSPTRPGSPTLIAPAKNDEEEVNLEYIRNVILQFLEHKEMRPNLVRVLSIILHFTPQETRRLIAKV